VNSSDSEKDECYNDKLLFLLKCKDSESIFKLLKEIKNIYNDYSEYLNIDRYDRYHNIRNYIGHSREKILIVTSKLEQVNEYSVPVLEKESSFGKINTLLSLDYFLTQKVITNINSKDYTELILSFREVLQEKDFYKNAYEEQKSHLELSKKAYEDIKEINTNLDTIEEKTHEFFIKLNDIVLISKEKQEKVIATVQMASEVIKNRESFKNKIIELVSKNEEEQRSEKQKLSNQLAELKRESDQKNHIKDERLEQRNQRVEELLVQGTVTSEQRGQEKIDTFMKIADIKEESKSQLFDLQKTIAAQDAKIRSTVPMMFTKLCSKLEIKGDKRKQYLLALKNKNLSVMDLLEKVEEFMADDDFE
jgi:hypothetical protein